MTMFRPRAYERQHMCLQPTDAQPTVESHVCPGCGGSRRRHMPIISVRQKLQDKAVEPDVLGLVHHTHAATTELFDDAVGRDGLADHGIDEC
jgi:hypothetical protein